MTWLVIFGDLTEIQMLIGVTVLCLVQMIDWL